MDRSERSDKRARILDAALEVFSRKGVFATRIADIAAEAGIAYGLVYHYFKNKEEVLHTIFEEQWARVTDSLERADKEGVDTEDRLRRVARVFMFAYQRRPQVVELLLLEFTRTSKFLEPAQIEAIERAFSVVTRILERAQRAGELRGDLPPAVLMLLFVGGLQHIMQTQVLGTFVAPPEFDRDGPAMVVNAFLSGVTAK